ncbi:MAG: hypothetical protein ACYTEZ_18080 [Planctomycetota bacterium]|jgi:hypothetical protein
MNDLRQRLWDGEALRVLFGEDVGFDVWVERRADPPRVYAEGQAFPIGRFDEVVARVERYLEEDGVRVLWNAALPFPRDFAL